MANPIYYNEHQILTGLYTAGGELIYQDGTPYIGPYHRYPNNTYWSEFNPSDITVQLFRDEKKSPFNNLSQLYKKDLLKKISNYIEPSEYYPVVTNNDYENGFIERYFVQKNDNINIEIIEIDLDQYMTINTANNPGIDGVSWKSGFLQWYLNKSMALINNPKQITLLSKKLPGIVHYLKNIFEFTR